MMSGEDYFIHLLIIYFQSDCLHKVGWNSQESERMISE